MKEAFLGRLPILDRTQNLVAFELLFRSSEQNKVNVIDNSAASAHVIIDIYGQLGIDKVMGNRRGFIKVDAELLMDDALYLLPKSQVVFEILRTVEFNAEIIRRCKDLRQKGYQLAISNVTELGDQLEHILPLVNVVKVNPEAANIDEQTLRNLLRKLKRWPVLLLAEKVENRQTARYCLNLGFHMLQGFYFAQPEVITGKRADPAKLSLLKLMVLIVKDEDVSEIENELKYQPGLSYNLLRMVNSAAMGLSTTVNSIKRAITILGRKQLQRWVQILLYTARQHSGCGADALMQTATVRGKLLELIACKDRPHDKNHQDRAFMVGILSLLDSLLDMDMNEVVKTLSIQKDMCDALIARRGYLGRQLELIEAYERGEFDRMQSILHEFGFLEIYELTQMELEASAWANQINEALNQTKPSETDALASA
ncbi:MAG: EAL domain-containing protein [Nitrosomonas sp.]|nr:EAL domain-containing protein [Nitrosomonas sp.]